MAIKGSKAETPDTVIVVNGHGARLSDRMTLNNFLVLAGSTDSSYNISVKGNYPIERDLLVGKLRPMKDKPWHVYQEGDTVYNISISPWKENEVLSFANRVCTQTDLWSEIDGKQGLIFDRDPKFVLFVRNTQGEIEQFDARVAKEYLTEISQHPEDIPTLAHTAIFAYFPSLGKVKVLHDTSLQDISTQLHAVETKFSLVCATCHGISGIEPVRNELDTEGKLLDFDSLLSEVKPACRHPELEAMSYPNLIDDDTPHFGAAAAAAGAGAAAAAEYYATSISAAVDEPESSSYHDALVASKPPAIEITSKTQVPTFMIKGAFCLAPDGPSGTFTLDDQIVLSPHALVDAFKLNNKPQGVKIEQMIHRGELPCLDGKNKWQVSFPGDQLPNVRLHPERQYSGTHAAGIFIKQRQFLSHLVSHDDAYLAHDSQAFLILKKNDQVVIVNNDTAKLLLQSMIERKYDFTHGRPLALVCPQASHLIVLGHTNLHQLSLAIASQIQGAHLVFMASISDEAHIEAVPQVNVNVSMPSYVTAEVIRFAFVDKVSCDSLDAAFLKSDPTELIHKLYGLNSRNNEYEFGPLLKNQATYDFEHMVHLFLAYPGLVQLNIKNLSIEIEGYSINMSELISKVNLSHVHLSHLAPLFERYILENKTLIYTYDRSQPGDPKCVHLKTLADFDLSPGSDLEGLTLGELFAINLYSQHNDGVGELSNYRLINELLSNPDKILPRLMVDYENFKFILLTIGFLSSALNHTNENPSQMPQVVYRGESTLPVKIYEDRRNACLTGDVLSTNRFLSTSMLGSAANNIYTQSTMFNKSIIVWPIGKYIRQAAAHDHEHECLSPGSELVYDLVRKDEASGITYFVAHPVTTPSLLRNRQAVGMPWFLTDAMPELEDLFKSHLPQPDSTQQIAVSTAKVRMIRELLSLIGQQSQSYACERDYIDNVQTIIKYKLPDIVLLCPKLHQDLLKFMDLNQCLAHHDLQKFKESLDLANSIESIVANIHIYLERVKSSDNLARMIQKDNGMYLTQDELQACISELSDIERILGEDIPWVEVLDKISIYLAEKELLNRLPKYLRQAIEEQLSSYQSELTTTQRHEQLLVRLNINRINNVHKALKVFFADIEANNRMGYLLKQVGSYGCLLDSICFKRRSPSNTGEFLQTFYANTKEFMEQFFEDVSIPGERAAQLQCRIQANVVANVTAEELEQLIHADPSTFRNVPFAWPMTTPGQTLIDVLVIQLDKLAILQQHQMQALVPALDECHMSGGQPRPALMFSELVPRSESSSPPPNQVNLAASASAAADDIDVADYFAKLRID